MWRRTALAMGCLVVVHAAPISGQDASRPYFNPPAKVRLELVLGRLTLFNPTGDRIVWESSAEDGSRHETVTVSGCVEPSLRYEFEDARQSISLHIHRASDVRLIRTPRDGVSLDTLELIQRRGQPLRLVIERGDARREFSGSSVWHLLMRQDEACSRELPRVLSHLRSDWHLQASAEAIEADLIGSAPRLTAPDRETLQKHVLQLNSPRFAERQTADRALRRIGIAAMPFLAQLERAHLSGEQRQRIRCIERHLAVTTCDTVDRVAAWMRHDDSVWFHWLTESDGPRRVAAQQHFKRAYPEWDLRVPADRPIAPARVAKMKSLLGIR